MAQGYKKTAKKAPSSAKAASQQPKRGARIIKPKKSAAVQAHAFRKKLTSEHIRLTEKATAAKARNPGSTGGASTSALSLIKPDSLIIRTAQAAKARRKDTKKSKRLTRPTSKPEGKELDR